MEKPQHLHFLQGHVDPVIGQVLAHYRILEKLGEGGMGVVYMAEDTRLHRRVALKFLPAHALSKDQNLLRFTHEARAAAALNHPNIATIYEIGEAEGKVYFAMELVEGQTLHEKIHSGPMKIREAFRVAGQIAGGLQAAHEKGIIHRDIKSANIILTENSDAKITDFGIAKLPASTRATQVGTTLGTIAYISPEQALGEEVDHRADLWSLGVVIYEMISGRLPFRGEYEPAVIYSILNVIPDPLTSLRSGVPLELERIINKLLTKDPSMRYQHADEVQIDLKAAEVPTQRLSGNRVSTNNPSAFSRISRETWLGLVAGLVVGLLLTVAAFWVRSTPPPQHADIEQLSIPLLPTQQLNLTAEGNDLALSPDGRLLAYVADNGEGPRLHLRQLGRFDRTTEIPGSEQAAHPFFSADGKTLGFYAAGRFMKVTLNQTVRSAQPFSTVSTLPMGATWKDKETLIIANGNTGLFLLSASDDQLRPLLTTRPDEGELGFLWPEMLPGGQAALFTIWRGEDLRQASLAVVDLNAGTYKDLGIRGANARYAPSGHLVYALWDNDDIGEIVTVPFDLERLLVTGAPRVQVSGVAVRQRGAMSFSFSETGRLAYYQQQSDARSLVWVDRSGNKTPLVEGLRRYDDPRLSPDGRLLALQINADIYLYNILRRTLNQLTSGGSNFEPVWHPDGDRIVFSSDRSGEYHLYEMPIDGNALPARIVEGAFENYAASWSMDGKTLAYYVRKTADDRDLYTWSPADGGTRAFLATEANERTPMFSPNGAWIAYVSDESGHDEIYVRPHPPRGNEAYRISTEGGTEPVWWPDAPLRSLRLSYRKADQLMVVELDTTPRLTWSKPTAWFSGRYHATLYRSVYDIHPYDERFLMIAEEDLYNQINVLLNWFDTLHETPATG